MKPLNHDRYPAIVSNTSIVSKYLLYKYAFRSGSILPKVMRALSIRLESTTELQNQTHYIYRAVLFAEVWVNA